MPAGDQPRGMPPSPTPAAVADFDEFSRALVEIGLIGDEELRTFAAGCSEGVLGLSRALVKAGKLTPYQAAAVYQKKSRGLLIGDYLILEKLGRGGTGVVFKVRHRRLGRLGALKILPPSLARDHTAVMRFRREVEAAGRLKHPNLVAAQDADEDRGVHFLVMDCAPGHDLDRVVRERGPMQALEAIDSVIQAARGLEAAHAEGIVHRGIKPANLMLDSAGNVRVLDLGLARIESGMSMGTIDYMAPEQADDSRRADHRADIYSLGCTLCYLLTGREPFPGETVRTRMIAHMERPAPSLRTARPDVSSKLDAAYQRMMAKRPEDRPASMTEVISLLESCKAPAALASTSAGEAPKRRPDPMVFGEAPLKQQPPANTSRDPSIFARREEREGLRINNELGLEDLVMDVRPETPQAPLARAPKPAASTAPLQRAARLTARGRTPRRAPLAAALASIALLGAAFAAFVFLRRPDPSRNHQSQVGVASADTAENRRIATPAPTPPPETVVKTLFDGTSGQGWMLCDRKQVPRRSIQRDGLNPHGTGSYLVVYDQKLGDFVLDFDYKLTKGCNSGVFLRVSDLNDPIHTGIEVALDDTRRDDNGDSGGFNGLVGPRVFAQKPTGEWNHMTIAAVGPRITVVLNEQEVSTINLDEWTVPGKRPDGTDHKFKNVAPARLARRGYVGFQDLGGDCWYRKIVVRNNQPATS